LDFIEFSDAEVMDFFRLVALNVRRLRKERGLSQLDLALAIGHKSMSTIGKIEAGLEGKHYNLEHLYKISKVLDVEICELVKL
jgi:transcriptional regulator with XRE-family HTH domain